MAPINLWSLANEPRRKHNQFCTTNYSTELKETSTATAVAYKRAATAARALIAAMAVIAVRSSTTADPRADRQATNIYLNPMQLGECKTVQNNAPEQ